MLLRLPCGFMGQGCCVEGFGVGLSGATGIFSGEEKECFHSSNIVVWLAVLVIMRRRLVHDEK